MHKADSCSVKWKVGELKRYKNLKTLKVVADDHGSLKLEIVEDLTHVRTYDAYSEPNEDHENCMRRCQDYCEDHDFIGHDFIS